VEQQKYADKTWYEGGLWRAPEILPGVATTTQKFTRQREAISLSSLFFHLVIVTAFTRVGVAISNEGFLGVDSLIYFAVFWSVWKKEDGYSTRFDTTDLSAQLETLLTCFAVLFATLSVQAPIASTDGTRIMMMAAFIAGMHCLLHVRVAFTNRNSDGPLSREVTHYAMFNIVMTLLEMTVWLVGIFVVPVEWPFRLAIFVGGIVMAMRVPRAFLANDFHGMLNVFAALFWAV